MSRQCVRLWDKTSLLARIADTKTRRRFPAGSPNREEIKAYGRALRRCRNRELAVVLGMTPELRKLVAGFFERVISIDRNAQAIQIYQDWLPRGLRSKEKIIEADWLDLPKVIGRPVSAVVGDGIFGNLKDVQAHAFLLRQIKSVLAKYGRFVTRMAVIPRGFRPQRWHYKILLKEFRSKKIDGAEFGFGSRFLGHYGCCYDPSTHTLKNKKIFQEFRQALARGELSETEYSYIQRYYFSGDNCIVKERTWELLLRQAGFGFKIQPCQGKSWYQYYKVYDCYLS